MIAGAFFYGPLDRWLGTRKWVVVAGTVALMLRKLESVCANLQQVWQQDPAYAVIERRSGISRDEMVDQLLGPPKRNIA